MEVSQLRVRPAYYFSWPDQEILEDHILSLSCDEETWLYKVDTGAKDRKRYFELGSPFQDPTAGGTVDSRTYTRRKHCALRPSLESVVESPLFNRSSLGLLSSSKLLNDSLRYMESPPLESQQEKTSSSSIGFEKKSSSNRVFKLDSPFMNVAVLGGSKFPVNNFSSFERTRLNSDASDISVPYSLENCSFIEKSGQMTESLLNFLEKRDYKNDIQSLHTDEADRTIRDPLINFPDNCETKDGEMTDSLVNFIDPVNCRPPSGFRDNEMIESVVNVHDVDGFPNCEMTNSINNYLENVKSNTSSLLVKSRASSEVENIPPVNCVNADKYQNLNSSIVVIDDENEMESMNLNSTYDVGKNGTYDMGKNEETTYDLNNKIDDVGNIPFTNTVNISRTKNERSSSCNPEINRTRSLNTTYEKKINAVKDRSEKSFKVKALNSRDLNLNETFETNRHIPSKNSTFNTTFTKLSPQASVISSNITKLKCSGFARSTEMLNGGLEDDTTSSASDSSFSSCSTKPRSVDELRTIALQQESSLVPNTSTPTDSCNKPASITVDMDINLSPIKRNIDGRHSESRSANSSPVPDHQHPITKLTAKGSQRMVPASSLSNIARPKLSGMRMPQPVRRFTAPQMVEPRPSTAPVAAPIQTSKGIPRPQLSRLPMPRFRGSSIPGPRQRYL